jgi:hypothetical protein
MRQLMAPTQTTDYRVASRLLTAFAITAFAAALAACTTAPSSAPVATSVAAVSAPAVPVATAQLPGNWGLASYHLATDRDRTVAQARVACGNPCQIGQGANGGVVMHLPDQSQPTEIFVKTDAAGRSFIGPKGAPGMGQDRVVLSFDDGVLVTEWIDPGTRERFGTMVFARCT